ncbi:MAG TPA: M48 family metallopeptidase [Thermoanaerobaculia bacterium]|nr:M48 family metallopeptidase [Thermoanaerobaculia bacterium]
MRFLAKVALALAAVAVATTIVVTVAAQEKQPAPQQQQTDKRFQVQVTPEMVRHSRITETLYFVGLGYSLLMLFGILATGLSRRMRDTAVRATKRPFVQAMLYVSLFVLVTTLLELPLSYYAGFVVPHQFDLSAQSLAGWLGDEAKGLALSLVLSAVVGALALLGIRKVKRWWLALWLGSIPLIVLLVVVQPIILDPIFNKFEPLKDEQLRRDLLDLASRAGIEGSRVSQVNKSKQTKTMNAYVNGVGPTNRIVMWDTLLAKMNHDEIIAVMGHEMGHYVMKHIWKGLAFSLVVSFFVFFFAQRFSERGIAKWGAKWGVENAADPAAVPWLLLVATIIGFFLSPVISGYSRSNEHDADMFSLELTHLNESMATAFVKLAEDSKQDPNPPAIIEFWRYSHPAISKRIAFVLGYKPWEHGEPNRMWKTGK